MFNIACNIDKSDRTNRIVFGIIVLLGVLFGFGKFFFVMVGIVLIVEGVIGWCGIPHVVSVVRGFFK